MRDRFADDEGGLWDDPRRRASAILLILAMVAILIVSIMVFFVGTSTGHHDTGLIEVGTTAAPTATPTGSATASRRTRSSSPATSAAPKPISTAHPCPSPRPCVVAGDNGAAVAALNKLRTSHGRPAVNGAASAQAQQCALSQGNGPTCQPHYAWQPVATQDGTQAITKMAQQDGGKWLLDPAMSLFSVGWAYTPGPNGGPGQYSFVVLKVN